MAGREAQAIREELQRSLAADRVHGAYLFEGPPGSGRRATAAWFARLLLRGEAPEPAEGEPVEFPAHPDLHVVEPDGAYVKVDQVRALQRALGLVANEGGRRVGVILGAERLRVEAANALLKTLEEPPRGASLVLVAESSEGLPRTLRSRTTRLRFGAPREADVARALVRGGVAEADARLAAALGGASEASARAWVERHGEAAAELASALEQAGSLTPTELLELAESFRGGGDAARERMELFLDVYGALARRRVEEATRSGDAETARRWLDRAEACAASAREWRRRNLSPQLVVEGLLFDLTG
jgi:DNA polymerase-3 subunit delta'